MTPSRRTGDPDLRARPAIGIDIGGTTVRAAVVGSRGQIVRSLRSATPVTVQRAEELLAEMVVDLAAGRDITAVGLGVAGFVSADRTRLMFAPHLAWRDAPVPRRLADRVGVPVVMEHDVNCAAWAEHRLGAARASRIALLVAVGTGIGAGLVVDGRIYRGAFGVAPELGHVVVVPDGRSCPCGKSGCWERYCSGTALAATARGLWASGPTALAEMAGGDPAAVTGAMVAAAAHAGDAVALAAMADLGHWLGIGLAIACDVLDPEIIVIGGGVSLAADLFLDTTRSVLSAHLTGGTHRPQPRITLARFRDAAGMVGAALLAHERANGPTQG